MYLPYVGLSHLCIFVSVLWLSCFVKHLWIPRKTRIMPNLFFVIISSLVIKDYCRPYKLWLCFIFFQRQDNTVFWYYFDQLIISNKWSSLMTVTALSVLFIPLDPPVAVDPPVASLAWAWSHWHSNSACWSFKTLWDADSAEASICVGSIPWLVL